MLTFIYAFLRFERSKSVGIEVLWEICDIAIRTESDLTKKKTIKWMKENEKKKLEMYWNEEKWKSKFLRKMRILSGAHLLQRIRLIKIEKYWWEIYKQYSVCLSLSISSLPNVILPQQPVILAIILFYFFHKFNFIFSVKPMTASHLFCLFDRYSLDDWMKSIFSLSFVNEF